MLEVTIWQVETVNGYKQMFHSSEYLKVENEGLLTFIKKDNSEKICFPICNLVMVKVTTIKECD